MVRDLTVGTMAVITPEGIDIVSPPGLKIFFGNGEVILNAGHGAMVWTVVEAPAPIDEIQLQRLLARVGDARERTLIVADHVGSAAANAFRAARLQFLDRSGNCHIGIPGQYFAWVEGRAPPRRLPHERAIRDAGLRVLFALLVAPDLVRGTSADLARESGTGAKAAREMIRRLESDGTLVRGKTGLRWSPKRRAEWLERWFVGYHQTLRPSLSVGRFRAAEQDPFVLEARLQQELDQFGKWCFGGAAGAFRVTPHYRSERTVVHLEHVPADMPRRLRLSPSKDGPLVVLRTPGPLAFRGVVDRTAHPLLIYAEMLDDPNERAREAARIFAERLHDVF